MARNWYSATKSNTVNDTDVVLLYDGSVSKTVEISNIKGADNLTDEAVTLVGADGNTYRVFVDSTGTTKAIREDAFSAPDPAESANNQFKGLIINQIYGGGSTTDGTPVSHSFIELYNLSANSMNLKGLYLWYKSKTVAWTSLPLQGIVPPYTSFLIRGFQHNSVYSDDTRLAINQFDQEWMDNGVGMKFADTGFSVYLGIGSGIPDVNPLRNSTSLEGVVTTYPRYIDLLGGGGNEANGDSISAYEKNYNYGMSRYCACRRIDFYNGAGATDMSGYSNGSGDNKTDSEIIDYRTCDVEAKRPRSLADGFWDMYVDKEEFNFNTANVVNLGYGENGETTRTFTWQSKVMKKGYVQYKLKTATEWTSVESNTTFLKHRDCVTTVHSAIVSDLSIGTYVYRVGNEGYWSDEAEFVVKTYGQSEPIRVLWTTDEQSWTEEESSVWGACYKAIQAWEAGTGYDFTLDTGDESQNANRRFEFQWYYNGFDGENKRVPHMTTCGFKIFYGHLC